MQDNPSHPAPYTTTASVAGVHRSPPTTLQTLLEQDQVPGFVQAAEPATIRHGIDSLSMHTAEHQAMPAAVTTNVIHNRIGSGPMSRTSSGPIVITREAYAPPPPPPTIVPAARPAPVYAPPAPTSTISSTVQPYPPQPMMVQGNVATGPGATSFLPPYTGGAQGGNLENPLVRFMQVGNPVKQITCLHPTDQHPTAGSHSQVVRTRSPKKSGKKSRKRETTAKHYPREQTCSTNDQPFPQQSYDYGASQTGSYQTRTGSYPTGAYPANTYPTGGAGGATYTYPAGGAGATYPGAAVSYPAGAAGSGYPSGRPGYPAGSAYPSGAYPPGPGAEDGYMAGASYPAAINAAQPQPGAYQAIARGAGYEPDFDQQQQAGSYHDDQFTQNDEEEVELGSAHQAPPTLLRTQENARQQMKPKAGCC